MGMYNFMMSCGHQAKREVADPAKYYNIDREYYSKQGLCDKCWDRLKTDKEKSNEKINRAKYSCSKNMSLNVLE